MTSNIGPPITSARMRGLALNRNLAAVVAWAYLAAHILP